MEKQISKNDTARSWRAMRLVICLIGSIIAAGSAFCGWFNYKFDPINYARNEVASVEKAAKIVPPPRPVAVTNFDPQANGFGPALTNLPDFIPDPNPSFDPFRDAGASLETPYGRWDWKKIQEVAATPVALIIFEAAGLGFVAGIGGWFGAWLLIVVIAFIWWFILDRIREFARAIKGQ